MTQQAGKVNTQAKNAKASHREANFLQLPILETILETQFYLKSGSILNESSLVLPTVESTIP
jgi:hypothetical protein